MKNTRYLLLSTSLLVDRVFLHTGLVDFLCKNGNVTIWASSFEATDKDSAWNQIGAAKEPFPHVGPFREFPHNYLRRLNEFVWDYRNKLPSRLSMREHVRDRQSYALIRALKAPAKILAGLRTERILENRLERLLLSHPRSVEAEERLRSLKPDVIVSTGPFQFEQPGIFYIAKKLGIPTLAYIPSWDNITTKNRMVFGYDGYIVWNEQMKEELVAVYPQTKSKPIYAVGAPQFDVFHQKRFFETKEDFCKTQKLDPSIPIIVYAIGSPNFLKEHHGAVHLARRVCNGALGNVQLLVRPHPIHDNAEMKELFGPYEPKVRLQTTPNAGRALTERTQDEYQIKEWVNTFRHADVIVNLSSTVTVDAAIFDRPVVNLDFDPQPNREQQELIKDINHKWDHFKPIAESGGVWLVNDFDELVTAILTYIQSPALHKEERKWIVSHVCGYPDGNCGERMARAISDFVARPSKLQTL